MERIVLRSRGGKNGTPLFRKVVFKVSTMTVLILNGRNEVKFMVNEQSLWCKKYQSRKNRHEDEEHRCNHSYCCRREVATFFLLFPFCFFVFPNSH